VIATFMPLACPKRRARIRGRASRRMSRPPRRALEARGGGEG
jgi:hypothetical protein